MNTIDRMDAAAIELAPVDTAPRRPRDDFARHLRLRNRRVRMRRFVRGVTGILLILIAWQLMSQWLGLQLLLPEPLTVLRNVVSTLTVSDPHWVVRT